MKTATNFRPVLILFICTFLSFNFKAQDTIVKRNGEIISVKVTEVGTNAITYKKVSMPDGPTFVDYKTDIAFVKYNNGQKEVFTKELSVTTEKTMPGSDVTKNDPTKTNMTTTNSSSKNRIEFMNNKYTLNGQKVSRKDVDRLLGKSNNPAIIVAHKTAKATKVAQKIVGITSIPGTIAGGVASVSTAFTAVKDSRYGPTPTGSLVNMGMSFLGTMTLPIVSKILKNRRDKLYDKVIDLYNVTN